MRLEFHQLGRPFEQLRARTPERQRRLLASLADTGQQTPIVVVTAAEQQDRYVVIDGYQRIAGLRRLGKDTVEAVVWPMSEVEALDEECPHKPDEISAFGSELIFRDIPGKLV
jgi:ParB family chromosome partitioning protein